MEIEWFGWLTKPHMMVSMVDRLIMLGELLVVVGMGGTMAYILRDYK